MDTPEHKPKRRKILFILLLILIVGGGGFFYFQYYFVFGDGVKNGQLNNLVYKGYVFKTYEGRLIQVGIRPGITGQGIQSNDFPFSVEDKKLAERLELLSGKDLQLHYKEYRKAIPWRGYSRYIVDSIISVKDPMPYSVNPM
ncbi:MAG: hypothetical protein FWF54_11020 [Candidatus Azobacteroides sp.]|nr:hypothetical protein [Candidatus Azobacteroides sp.]